MEKRLKSILFFITFGMSLGTSLVIYAHTNFATKERVEELRTIMHRMDERIYDLHKKIVRAANK